MAIRQVITQPRRIWKVRHRFRQYHTESSKSGAGIILRLCVYPHVVLFFSSILSNLNKSIRPAGWLRLIQPELREPGCFSQKNPPGNEYISEKKKFQRQVQHQGGWYLIWQKYVDPFFTLWPNKKNCFFVFPSGSPSKICLVTCRRSNSIFRCASISRLYPCQRVGRS